MAITCPKCKSDQITAQKKGFSGGKALAGAVVAGPIGALAGTHGSGNVTITCLNCGNKWTPEQRLQQQKKERDEAQIRWKLRILTLYEEGNKEKAENLFLSRSRYSSRFPDLESVIKDARDIKQSRSDAGVFVVIVLMIAIAFLIWLIQ